ncbi:uncharacterized protein LOC126554413 [Aphis gossypii]|uniref:uncharacterized protein LOC126554413 n=1 Tax=Aphis gossypii TaxID=80765 RepID=UPI002158A280|nr:uncharacterized protein LOC126554413 [Aphis gossypii]
MLETEFYYELMKKKVASFGGADVNSALRIIMSKLFSNKLGIDITLTGTSLICKDKQSLQKSNFYKLIIESIRILFNTATEEQIKKPIASWLKHAKERSNRQNNTL